MTWNHKLLIVTGATLIALFVAIAAFSLGVYVGVHGWTAGPPVVAGPGPAVPRPANQGALPQGQPTQPVPQNETSPPSPNPRPQLVGRVQSINSEIITLDTLQGPRLFQIGQNAQVFRAMEGSQEPASPEEIRPGEHLAVFGHFEGNGHKQLIAMRLVLLPPPTDNRP